MLPEKLRNKIENRKKENSLRSLGASHDLIDFSSNDYLGFSRSPEIKKRAAALVKSHGLSDHGATGSRLLTGNHSLYEATERYIAKFHKAESSIIFNSGYTANVGFFQCVPQRGDIIFYDEYIHASIRDGIAMSHAKSFKFKHNDLKDLKKKYTAERSRISHDTQYYIVTESVFSMDGDTPRLLSLVDFCEENHLHFIVDEAHALGVLGNCGEGLVQELGIEEKVFARIVTFGKALGCHGAAILGSNELKEYLINFARSFIYTTALPPLSVATIKVGYEILSEEKSRRNSLNRNIAILQKYLENYGLVSLFIESESAIHCCKITGNENVKAVAVALQKNGFDVRPILSPTVPQGQERLRICLHSFNTENEIVSLVENLAKFLK